MIPHQELEIGDYVEVEYEGKRWNGEVIDLNPSTKQACVETEVQSFWYETDQLFAIPLNDEQLMKLQFAKEENADGSVKYKKGSFRILVPAKSDFSHFDMWYREDKRHNPDIHTIHQLQNAYHSMTKVYLTDEVIA